MWLSHWALLECSHCWAHCVWATLTQLSPHVPRTQWVMTYSMSPPCPRLVSCSVLSLEVLEGDNKNTHTRCVQTRAVSSLRVCFTRSLPQISLSSLCVRMCAHECKCRQRPEASDPPVPVPEPVVGTELRSSVRAVPAKKQPSHLQPCLTLL